MPLAELAIACLAGLAAGGVHALVGPDHLAAVGPISFTRRGKAVWSGLCWGLGHALGTWSVAVVALAGWRLVDVEQLSIWAERSVGLVLIGTGLWALHVLQRRRVHSHPHEHDGELHTHVHLHEASIDPAHGAQQHRGHGHATLGIGVLHGIAGVGPFLAILPAVVIGDTAHRLVYLLSYGLGAAGAMGAFAWAVGRLAARADAGSHRLYNGMLAGSAGTALSVGLFWLVA